MSKHTISGFLQWVKSKHGTNPRVEFNKYEFKTDAYDDYATVRTMEFEVEVPDDFDPTAEMVRGLEELKKAKRQQLAAELIELDERISKLQALPMFPREDDLPF